MRIAAVMLNQIHCHAENASHISGRSTSANIEQRYKKLPAEFDKNARKYQERGLLLNTAKLNARQANQRDA
jgi:hypothetical protein